MSKKWRMILLFCVVILLSACYFPIRREVPTEGEYYCDELKISIDFSIFKGGDPHCTKIYSSDGEYTIGRCMRDYGIGMTLCSADQQTVYVIGEYSYTNGLFTITAYDDDMVYTFERIN